MENTQQWLTVGDACDLYSYSERTLYRRMADGLLEFKGARNTRRISVASLDRLAASGVVGQQSRINKLVRQVQEQETQIAELEAEIIRKDELLEENRQRQDAIILELSRRIPIDARMDNG